MAFDDFHSAMQAGFTVAGQTTAVCATEMDFAATAFNEAEQQAWVRCPGRTPAQRVALARRIYMRGETARPRALRFGRWLRDERLISGPEYDAWIESLRTEPRAPYSPEADPDLSPEEARQARAAIDAARANRPAPAPAPPPRAPAPSPVRGELRDCAWPAPADGAILSPYGMRTSRQHPEVEVMHGGIDYSGAIGDPVYAIGDGVVTHATVNGAEGFGDYGMVVVLKHPQWRRESGTTADRARTEEVHSLYAHLSRLNVAPRANVRAGDVIGYIGNTNGSASHPGTTFETTARAEGRTAYSNPHLHFEMVKGPYPRPPVSQAASNPRAERLNPSLFLSSVPLCTEAPAPEAQAQAPQDRGPGPSDDRAPDRGREGSSAWLTGAAILGGLAALAYVFGRGD